MCNTLNLQEKTANLYSKVAEDENGHYNRLRERVNYRRRVKSGWLSFESKSICIDCISHKYTPSQTIPIVIEIATVFFI